MNDAKRNTEINYANMMTICIDYNASLNECNFVEMNIGSQLL